jgi:hypothetical protein
VRLAVALAAGIAAASAVRVGFNGHLGGPGPAVGVTASQGYLIPTDGNTIGHWNATDLKNATAASGTAWTTHGSPTFNAATSSLPASIGGFSSSAYFTQAAFGPLGQGPWLLVILASAPSYASNLVIQSGTTSTNGWYVQIASNGSVGFINGLTNSNIVASPSSSFAFGASIVNVIMIGMDGTKGWIQVNATSAASAVGVITSGAANDSIGAGPAGALPFNGTVYEELASLDTPTAALFAAIYQSIEAQL